MITARRTARRQPSASGGFSRRAFAAADRGTLLVHAHGVIADLRDRDFQFAAQTLAAAIFDRDRFVKRRKRGVADAQQLPFFFVDASIARNVSGSPSKLTRAKEWLGRALN